MNDDKTSLNDQFFSVDVGHIYGKTIANIERIVITKVLERTGGNQIDAAKRLGIHRNTLHSKLKKLGIDVRRFKR